MSDGKIEENGLSWLDKVKSLLDENKIEHKGDSEYISIDSNVTVGTWRTVRGTDGGPIYAFSIYISEKEMEIVFHNGLVDSIYFRRDDKSKKYEYEINDLFSHIIEERYGFDKGDEGYRKTVSIPDDAVKAVTEILSGTKTLELFNYLTDFYYFFDLVIDELDKIFHIKE